MPPVGSAEFNSWIDQRCAERDRLRRAGGRTIWAPSPPRAEEGAADHDASLVVRAGVEEQSKGPPQPAKSGSSHSASGDDDTVSSSRHGGKRARRKRTKKRKDNSKKTKKHKRSKTMEESRRKRRHKGQGKAESKRRKRDASPSDDSSAADGDEDEGEGTEARLAHDRPEWTTGPVAEMPRASDGRAAGGMGDDDDDDDDSLDSAALEELWSQAFWREKRQGRDDESDDDEEMIGPQPLPTLHTGDRISYGGALLPGEGDAIAQYVQSGKRIPRRGEVGMSADEIQRYEDAGFVMSGSRHKRMNEVRERKENQVCAPMAFRGGPALTVSHALPPRSIPRKRSVPSPCSTMKRR